jgi:hypothetical protein
MDRLRLEQSSLSWNPSPFSQTHAQAAIALKRSRC